jgi:hypothetical protein
VTTLTRFKIVLAATRGGPGHRLQATVTAKGYRRSDGHWKLIAAKRVGRGNGWEWLLHHLPQALDAITSARPGAVRRRMSQPESRRCPSRRGGPAGRPGLPVCPVAATSTGHAPLSRLGVPATSGHRLRRQNRRQTASDRRLGAANRMFDHEQPGAQICPLCAMGRWVRRTGLCDGARLQRSGPTTASGSPHHRDTDGLAKIAPNRGASPGRPGRSLTNRPTSVGRASAWAGSPSAAMNDSAPPPPSLDDHCRSPGQPPLVTHRPGRHRYRMVALTAACARV